MTRNVPWSYSLSLWERARVRGSGRGRFCVLLFGIFLVACTQQSDNFHPLTLLSPTGQRIELRVEVADSDEERSRGLMFREELSEGHGMLFVFDGPQMLSFWMKNTVIPLDILFFDEGGKLVSTATMEPCVTERCPIYASGGEAQFALEVPAGFVDRYGVGDGWHAAWGQP